MVDLCWSAWRLLCLVGYQKTQLTATQLKYCLRILQSNRICQLLYANFCRMVFQRNFLFFQKIIFYSSFIIISWVQSAAEQVPLLVGKAASPEFINRIVKIAISHDENIQHLDTIIVYHLGPNFIVELHVVSFWRWPKFITKNNSVLFCPNF